MIIFNSNQINSQIVDTNLINTNVDVKQRSVTNVFVNNNYNYYFNCKQKEEERKLSMSSYSGGFFLRPNNLLQENPIQKVFCNFLCDSASNYCINPLILRHLERNIENLQLPQIQLTFLNLNEKIEQFHYLQELLNKLLNLIIVNNVFVNNSNIHNPF